MHRREVVRPGDEFLNFYNHDFVRAAVGIPSVRVADPDFNVASTISLIEEAANREAILVLFPELGLSAYSCDDLFHSASAAQFVSAS